MEEGNRGVQFRKDLLRDAGLIARGHHQLLEITDEVLALFDACEDLVRKFCIRVGESSSVGSLLQLPDHVGDLCLEAIDHLRGLGLPPGLHRFQQSLALGLDKALGGLSVRNAIAPQANPHGVPNFLDVDLQVSHSLHLLGAESLLQRQRQLQQRHRVAIDAIAPGHRTGPHRLRSQSSLGKVGGDAADENKSAAEGRDSGQRRAPRVKGRCGSLRQCRLLQGLRCHCPQT
mmetsp:Transcript_21406/g.47447  ORF Transcript_21406/g.47447 Transcript_21406/m.47447 type:complete len:231 (+) Transcript_21406:807-1499(+)